MRVATRRAPYRLVHLFSIIDVGIQAIVEFISIWSQIAVSVDRLDNRTRESKESLSVARSLFPSLLLSRWNSPFRLKSEKFQGGHEIPHRRMTMDAEARPSSKATSLACFLSARFPRRRWTRNRGIAFFSTTTKPHGAAPHEFAHSTDASSSTKTQKSYLADNRGDAVSTSRYICGGHLI